MPFIDAACIKGHGFGCRGVAARGAAAGLVAALDRHRRRDAVRERKGGWGRERGTNESDRDTERQRGRDTETE